MRTLLLVPLFTVFACAHPFKRIQPGMTAAEVRAVTEDNAPTDVRTWPQVPGATGTTGPTAAFVMNDVVRQKAVTRTRASGGIPGVVRVSVREQAMHSGRARERPGPVDERVSARLRWRDDS